MSVVLSISDRKLSFKLVLWSQIVKHVGKVLHRAFYVSFCLKIDSSLLLDSWLVQCWVLLLWLSCRCKFHNLFFVALFSWFCIMITAVSWIPKGASKAMLSVLLRRGSKSWSRMALSRKGEFFSLSIFYWTFLKLTLWFVVTCTTYAIWVWHGWSVKYIVVKFLMPRM